MVGHGGRSKVTQKEENWIIIVKNTFNMEKKQEDNELLKEMCTQYNVSFEKMQKLLATIKEYQFKDRRTGVYEALKEIIKSDLKSVSHEV